MSVTEMTESLQFRSQAMAFESFSSGNKPFTVKDEVGFNFIKTFRKTNVKLTAKKRNNMCTRCGGRPHSSRRYPALSKICNTCEKVRHFSKKCRSKPQPNSGKYNKQNNFCEEKKIVQNKHLYHRRWECFILKNKSLACLRHWSISQ